MSESAAETINRLFETHELDILGVCDGRSMLEEEADFRKWLEFGYHGTMAYLENHARAKYRPANLLENCRSLIFVGLNYYQPRKRAPRDHGHVARYAWGRDYHKVLGKNLKQMVKHLREVFPADRFLAFTDATPLAERSFAARAGAGFIGRNTLLIRRGAGSFFVLGGIASTLELSAGDLEPANLPTAGGFDGSGCPPGCTRCIDACPTGALLEPHRINSRTCISYLTIEHRGSIPPHLHANMGAWIFGCDVCQEVCPFNKMAEETTVSDFLLPNAGASIAIGDILSIENHEQLAARFSGSPVMRAKRSGLVRNACIAAANLGLGEFAPHLEMLTKDTDPVIRIHAEWALSKLRAGADTGSNE